MLWNKFVEAKKELDYARGEADGEQRETHDTIGKLIKAAARKLKAYKDSIPKQSSLFD